MNSERRLVGFVTYSDILNNIVFCLMAILASYYFIQLRFGLTGHLSEVSIERLIDGTAQTPGQYQVLIPMQGKDILGLFDLLPPVNTPAPIRVFQSIELLGVLLLFVTFRYSVSLFLDPGGKSNLLAVTI